MEYKKGDVVQIHAYDHFSSDSNQDDLLCVSEFTGVVVDEDPLYLKLRYIKADISDRDSAEEFHHVFKAAIIKEDQE